MKIDYHVLMAYGGYARKLNKGDIIFRQGDAPYYFLQVMEGEVMVFSSSRDGKELIQNIFTAGQSFGEPPLMLNKPYPSTAQAITPATIVKIAVDKFMDILKDYPEYSKKLITTFAERIYHKAMNAQMWVSKTPEEKIALFLDKFRSPGDAETQVPFTRQQIADWTGLRVETVIRTLRSMSKSGKVKIMDRKLYV